MNINRLKQLAGIITEAKFDVEVYKTEKAEAMSEVREILAKLNFSIDKKYLKEPHSGLNAYFKELDPFISCDLVKKVIKEFHKKGWKDGVAEKDDLNFQLIKKNKNIDCYVQIGVGRKGVDVGAEEV